jgi:hypothetical protein
VTNTSHRKQKTFLYEYPLHWVLLSTKTYNRTLILGNTILKHGHHFDCWNQPLNMRMRVSYLDCHEAGLCCYLMIHIQNLLYPLQLFYFHLWPIYWLSLVLYNLLSYDVLTLENSIVTRNYAMTVTNLKLKHTHIKSSNRVEY